MSLTSRALGLAFAATCAGALVHVSALVGLSAARDAGVAPVKVTLLPVILSGLLVGVGLRTNPVRRRRLAPCVAALAGAGVALAMSGLGAGDRWVAGLAFALATTVAATFGGPGPDRARELGPTPPVLPDDPD